jgi:hypothetical protein
MQVPIDTEKLNGKKLNDLTLEDVQRLVDGEAVEAVNEIKEQDSTLTLGAIGSPYMVGPIDCQIAIGNLVLLHEIDSPFISGDIGEDGDELNTTDCINSLYVLAKGKQAIRPVMAIKQRIQDMLILKPMVENNPALFESLMDRVERISDARSDFANDAKKWYEENFVGCDFQEVINSVFAILTDVSKVAGDLPQSEEKKN